MWLRGAQGLQNQTKCLDCGSSIPGRWENSRPDLENKRLTKKERDRERERDLQVGKVCTKGICGMHGADPCR